MSVDTVLYGLLIARVETIVGFEVVHPRKGQGQPTGEHIRVAFVPNDTTTFGVSTSRIRKGFLFLTLVSPLGDYEIKTIKKAGEIQDYFPVSEGLNDGAVTVVITDTTIKAGSEVKGRWETPIRIGYSCV